MSSIVRWLMALPPNKRLIGHSFITAASFYGATFLVEFIANATQFTGWLQFVLHAAVFVVLLTLLVALYSQISDAMDRERKELEKFRETLSHAHQVCGRVLIRQLDKTENAQGSVDRVKEFLCSDLEDIKLLVQAAYETLEAAYGKSSSPMDRIDFEVTFMTKSFKDREITIPAAWNSDGRLPRSMILRAGNPAIYSKSVTAKVYAMESPRTQIIPSTSAIEYEELYPEQTQRIKSSIVYPIRSGSNELLGTLVVHCDKEYFFRHDREKYWNDLLEVFAKRIALGCVRIKLLDSMRTQETRIDYHTLATCPY